MKKVMVSLLLVLLVVGSGILVACAPRPAAPAPGVTYVLGFAGYRTGPFGATGTPVTNAVGDTINLINLKGGVDGHIIKLADIETGYETPRIVEAYERTKGMGTVFAFHPLSTGGAYAVTPKAFKDKVPIIHTGYGISAAAYGKAFPWNFIVSPTYWSSDATIMKYIADQEKGEAKLKGKKIAMVYLDIDYGRETLPFHGSLTKEFGYELIKYPIPWPGLEQAAIWTDIGLKTKPDWVIWRLWGASTPVALREADRVGYPMSRIIGSYWSPTVIDIWAFDRVKAKGIKHAEFVNPGIEVPIVAEILRELYDKGKGLGPREHVGTDLYNRGVFMTSVSVAALKTAADKFKHPLDADKIRWGWENLSPKALEWAGVLGLVPDIGVTPENHEGKALSRIVEWDGTKWVPIADWMAPYRHIVDALVIEAAGKFMRENPHLYR